MTDGHFRGRQKLHRPVEGLRTGRPCLGSACRGWAAKAAGGLQCLGAQGGSRRLHPLACPCSRKRLRLWPQGPLNRVLAPLSACQAPSSPVLVGPLAPKVRRPGSSVDKIRHVCTPGSVPGPRGSDQPDSTGTRSAERLTLSCLLCEPTSRFANPMQEGLASPGWGLRPGKARVGFHPIVESSRNSLV